MPFDRSTLTFKLEEMRGMVSTELGHAGEESIQGEGEGSETL